MSDLVCDQILIQTILEMYIFYRNLCMLHILYKRIKIERQKDTIEKNMITFDILKEKSASKALSTIMLF